MRALTTLPPRPLIGTLLRVGRRRARGEDSAGLTVHLVLANVPFDSTAADLERDVGAIASVAKIAVPQAGPGRGTGVAFVELVDAADADRVIAALDGVALLHAQHRPLRVHRGQPR